MMYGVSSGKIKSLSQISIEAQSEHNISVTKQGIDKKFNDRTLSFLKVLIEKKLSTELDQQIEAGWLKSINRVRIKDGSRFDLPDNYKEHLPGSGGSASEAGACIQFEFDLKSGHILDLSLTASNKPDIKSVGEDVDTLEKGDLVIRDLGYYSLSSLVNIESKGAFYISRLNTQTVVYETKDGKDQELDFKMLYSEMEKNKMSRISKDVLIGRKEKLPVRLIVELMPEAVYEKRVRKMRRNHQKKGYRTSKKHLFMSRFNLFITKLPPEILPDEVVSILYRIRWQIELIFKVWKSVIGIHYTGKMKYERWLCLLHFKLLLMVVNWNIIMSQRNQLYMVKGKLLSLNKCFKTLFDNSHRLRDAIKEGIKGITRYAHWAVNILTTNHWLERKSKSLGLEEILYNILLIKYI